MYNNMIVHRLCRYVQSLPVATDRTLRRQVQGVLATRRDYAACATQQLHDYTLDAQPGVAGAYIRLRRAVCRVGDTMVLPSHNGAVSYYFQL